MKVHLKFWNKLKSFTVFETTALQDMLPLH